MTLPGHPLVLVLSTDQELALFLRGVIRQVMPSLSLQLGEKDALHDAVQAKLIVADYATGARSSLAAPLTRIRAKAPKAPLLAILSDTSGVDLVLASGADDWIIRESSRNEFIARIRYCRVRSSAASRVSPAERPLSIEPDGRSLSIGGVPLKLRHCEFKILCHLASNAGRTVSAPELTAALESGGGSGSVRTHVMSLRRALTAAGHGDLILTDRSQGYRFIDSASSAFACGYDLTLFRTGLR